MSSRDLDWTGVCVSLQLSAWPCSFVVLVCPKLPRYSRVPSTIRGPSFRSVGFSDFVKADHIPFIALSTPNNTEGTETSPPNCILPYRKKTIAVQTFSHTQTQILYKKAILKCFMWMLHFTLFRTWCRNPTSLTCVYLSGTPKHKLSHAKDRFQWRGKTQASINFWFGGPDVYPFKFFSCICCSLFPPFSSFLSFTLYYRSVTVVTQLVTWWVAPV